MQQTENYDRKETQEKVEGHIKDGFNTIRGIISEAADKEVFLETKGWTTGVWTVSFSFPYCIPFHFLSLLSSLLLHTAATAGEFSCQ